jgi:cellulose synthase/poly-beta-1,6-N-acetylglucosamine synthase-like glycosyltransferase
MKPISPFGIPDGLSALIWGSIGLIRFIYEKIFPINRTNKRNIYSRKDIAVIMPAHNEELVIRKSLQALKTQLDSKQIYVVSDGSIDKTRRRARLEEVHTTQLLLGKGKAKAMIHLIKLFKLFERYKLIFIVDADTQIDKTFISRALPFLNDPKVAVVFAGTKIYWPKHLIPSLKYYFISYRERLNKLLVYFYIYGQTWKYTSVNYVIPGFCTIYKTEVLKQLEIDTPGILIEDFNLAFQVLKKNLGKIAYHPSLISWEQYPDNLRDYWKQVRRWNIGFNQTIRKNGIWPSIFWLALGLFLTEIFINSLLVLILPWLVILELSGIHFNSFYISMMNLFKIQADISYPVFTTFILIIVYDYLETVILAIVKKRPQWLFYGLGFFFMHYVTSLILISSIIPGFFGSSEGKWNSPTRRRVGT